MLPNTAAAQLPHRFRKEGISKRHNNNLPRIFLIFLLTTLFCPDRNLHFPRCPTQSRINRPNHRRKTASNIPLLLKLPDVMLHHRYNPGSLPVRPMLECSASLPHSSNTSPSQTDGQHPTVLHFLWLLPTYGSGSVSPHCYDAPDLLFLRHRFQKCPYGSTQTA